MVKAEVVKQVTGVHIELTAKEARDMYAALYHMNDKLGISSADGRGAHPELKSLFYLYDLLNEGGFDQ